MNHRAKTLIIVVCAFLCAVGAIFSVHQRDTKPQMKGKVRPIDNRVKRIKEPLWA